MQVKNFLEVIFSSNCLIRNMFLMPWPWGLKIWEACWSLKTALSITCKDAQNKLLLRMLSVCCVTSQRGFIPQLCVLNEPSLEFLPSEPATDWSLISDPFYIPSWSQRRGRVEMTQAHWSRRLGETHVGSTHRQKCSNTHFALKSQTCTVGLRVKQHAESHTTALRRHSSQASIHLEAPLASHFTITPTHQTTQAQPAQSSYPSDFLYVYEKLRTALSLAGFGRKKHRGKS